MRPVFSLTHLTPSSQGLLSLNLVLGWQPVSPSYPVSCPIECEVTGTEVTPGFSMGAGSLTKGHVHAARVLPHRAISQPPAQIPNTHILYLSPTECTLAQVT